MDRGWCGGRRAKGRKRRERRRISRTRRKEGVEERGE
jgi:hypothetical protein